jgi:hypothetical protein
VNQFEPSTDPARAASSVSGIADRGAVAEVRLYDAATARLLGTYGTRDAAYAAADDHSLGLLAMGGEWITGEHLVAWVDERGRIDLAIELTHVGPSNDLEGCREWLRSLPGRCGARRD